MRRTIFISILLGTFAGSDLVTKAEADGLDGASILSFSAATPHSALLGSSSMPTLRLTYDRFVTPEITVGSVLSYGRSNWDDVWFGSAIDLHQVFIGGRAAYHLGRFLPTQRLDAWVGGTMGYGYTALTTDYDTAGFAISQGAGFFNIHAGARVELLPRVAGFAEAGYDLLDETALLVESGPNISVGLAFRF